MLLLIFLWWFMYFNFQSKWSHHCHSLFEWRKKNVEGKTHVYEGFRCTEMYFEKLDILKWFPIIQIVYSWHILGLGAVIFRKWILCNLFFNSKGIYRICNKCNGNKAGLWWLQCLLRHATKPASFCLSELILNHEAAITLNPPSNAWPCFSASESGNVL